jgi:hypothetical protein
MIPTPLEISVLTFSLPKDGISKLWRGAFSLLFSFLTHLTIVPIFAGLQVIVHFFVSFSSCHTFA